LLTLVPYFNLTGPQVPTICIGHILIDIRRQVIVAGGKQEIVVTKNELNLLWHLAINAGRVVPLNELFDVVWHVLLQPATARSRVKSAIKRLRQKIERDPGHPRYILTRRGYGYYMPKEVAV